MPQLLLMLLLLFSPIACSQALFLRSDFPHTYTVKQGDTLWDIAGLYLDDPWRWPQLWQINPAIANPHLIYPGDRLTMALVNGQPRLRVSRAGVSPSQPIKLLPFSRLRPFLQRVTVVDPPLLEPGSRVVGASRDGLRYVEGDTLYSSEPLVAGQSYGVYRQRQSLRDPESGQMLGTELVLAASGVAQADGQGLMLTHSRLEAASQAPLYALAPQLEAPLFFHLGAAPATLEAQIIASPQQMREMGPGELLYLNKGTQDGARPGQVLFAYHRRPLPDQRTVMVYRGRVVLAECFQRVCLAVVTSARHPLRLTDWLLPPSPESGYAQYSD
ncbi:LysM peptidoglycan-binding domain-containing protein [Ferrimonas kyonanensis]|uniref:LysM peptidoglycan-binding domain-containing protein n=1 Tax=Ferrimonas kyonanensis TaxID=364763 RepID=UPI00042388BD|nr:LysM domain-containing protein [Ferrimonas kyonanensis]